MHSRTYVSEDWLMIKIIILSKEKLDVILSFWKCFCTTNVWSFLIFWRCSRPTQESCFSSFPSQSLSPVLSWQKPPNIPDNVVLTYHLKVTNITSESNLEVFNDVFNITGVDLSQLPVRSGCSLIYIKWCWKQYYRVNQSVSHTLIEMSIATLM